MLLNLGINSYYTRTPGIFLKKVFPMDAAHLGMAKHTGNA